MNVPHAELSLASSVLRLRTHLRWPDEFPMLAPEVGSSDPDVSGTSAAQWRDAVDVVDDPPQLLELIEAHRNIVGARQAGTAATLLWKDYCQVFSLLPVASWFVDRRVPDMGSANLRLRLSARPPLIFPTTIALRGTCLAGGGEGGADLEPVGDEDALVERLAATLWDDHLEAMGRSISQAVGVDIQILKGLAISVAVAALPRVAALGATFGRDQFQDADRLVDAMGGKDLVEMAVLSPPGSTPEPMALRYVCCQAHRVKPHLNCSTCPLIDDDARTAQLETHGYGWQRR